MPLTLRRNKGSVLTKDEVDDNFVYLETTKQPLNANLTALAQAVGYANSLPYFASPTAIAATDFPQYSRLLISQNSEAAWKGASGLNLRIGQTNGLATLDAAGKIPVSQLPPLAVNEVFTVASQSAMLALTAERGDVAIRTDQAGKAYILSQDNATVLANWISLDQALSLALAALNALTPAADRIPFFTGTATADLLPITTVGKAVIAAIDQAAARTAIAGAKSGANSDITSLTALTTAITVAQGGSGATTAAGARSNLGAASSGANGDITSLTGLSTAITVIQGGTGASGPTGARANLGAAASGVNNDITGLDGLGWCRTFSSTNPANRQGSYMLWNTGNGGLSGSADWICNRGGGNGGFTWRSVNVDNTVGGPSLMYSFDGLLTIPAGGVPATDGGANFGRSNLRWGTYFGVSGAINTSDAREKTPIRTFTEDEITAARQLGIEIGCYQWLTAIADKGQEARVHVGLTVQRAIEIMSNNGLDPLRYAFICYDEWPEEPEVTREEIRGKIYSSGELIAENALYEEFNQYLPFPAFTWEETSREIVVTKEYVAAGNRYGFRYDQLALFIARGQEERIARLERLLLTE